MRRKLWKRMLLCLLLTVTLMGPFLYPEAAATQPDMTWSLMDGVLRVSGTMEDYSNSKKAPWYDRRAEITRLTVTEGVTAIGANAFWGCENLVEVSLPQTLTRIGSGAFFQCAGLTEITIPAGVTVLEQGVFGQCEALSAVALHDEITAIEKDAFSRCYNLRHITLPAKLERIGEHAFFGCVQLQQLTFPETLKRVETAAFYSCSDLTVLRFMDSAPAFADQALLGITATAYYDQYDSSWSLAAAQAYGGSITWVAECFHQYTMTFAPPTCEQEGYSTYTCDLCGDRYQDLYIPALGHTPNDPVQEGNTLVVYCASCGKELSREQMQTHLPGDINGDGRVNNKDCTRLFQHLSGWGVEVKEDALDVNGDGRVNNKDCTRLFQYLSGWQVEIY